MPQVNYENSHEIQIIALQMFSPSQIRHTRIAPGSTKRHSITKQIKWEQL